MKAHKTVDVVNAKHLANQHAKQAVVLLINLAKIAKNSKYEKCRDFGTFFTIWRKYIWYININ